MIHGRPTILAEGLEKRYGKFQALRGLDLVAEAGTILGLLGPNGSGKTTTVRILTTLLQPDGGRAEVAGFDVVKQANEVRAHIGLTGQYATVDDYLTGRENLEMIGRLYQLPKSQARRRANELLERFDLTDAASRPARTYSGGMRRRLDIAASLILPLPVLFLDEPTTGLDIRSRQAVWELVREVVERGTTVLLTTQYLEEADQLAHQIAVIDEGQVIATGTAGELKTRVGGERLELTITHNDDLEEARRTLQAYGTVHVDAKNRLLDVPVTDGSRLLASVVRDLDAAGVQLEELHLRMPTLDDVFLTLTGHKTSQKVPEQPDAPADGGSKKNGNKEVASI